MAIAARRPAPPPPTISTSWAARMRPSLTSELLVDEHFSFVVHDYVVKAAVVELLLGAPASTGEQQLFGDQPLLVLGHVLLPVGLASTGCESCLEAAGGCSHCLPP